MPKQISRSRELYWEVPKGIKGRAHLQDIREAVEDFKTSGKFVYAFSEGATQSDYLLQSVADSLFVGTLSELNVQGLKC